MFHNKYYDLDKLFSISKSKSYLYTDKNGNNFYLSELKVKTKNNIQVKLVFSRKKKNSNEFVTILSTDTDISCDEIMRIYAMRWNIEILFKHCKSLFKLGKEFQAKSYNLLVAHTTIVFIRHMVILYLSQTDEYCIQKDKTINKCYFDFSEFVKYVDLAISFQLLLCLIDYMLGLYCKQMKDIVSCQVRYFISNLHCNFNCSKRFFIWET